MTDYDHKMTRALTRYIAKYGGEATYKTVKGEVQDIHVTQAPPDNTAAAPVAEQRQRVT